MSLFFINRPIKQGRTPLDVLFRSAARTRGFFLPYLFLPFLLLLVSFVMSFFPRCRESVPFVSSFVPWAVSLRFPARNPLPLPLGREETHSLSGWVAPSGSLFAILFNFFAREESFYYLGARLQCLADNKPMKATFEPEGPLKSPFSRTSRFSLSLAHFHFLSFSHQVSSISFPLPVDSVPLPSRFVSSNTAM